MLDDLRSQTLCHLEMARRVADYAYGRGASTITPVARSVPDHLGAVLADSILQAGMNYRSVVKTRIERILSLFPEAATLDGILLFVKEGAVEHFLLWNHEEKVGRFIRLVYLLERSEILNTHDLFRWLHTDDYRDSLLSVSGIGPKTVDYLCCLMGMDCIAIDRHLRVFARDAGVDTGDYDQLKLIISYAADLLDIPRREFDSWIWNVTSQKANGSDQLRLV
jgi:hypothetical protein